MGKIVDEILGEEKEEMGNLIEEEEGEKKTKEEELKDYLNNLEVEIEDVDFGEKTIHQIKIDYNLLVDYYLIYFNEFRKHFAECGGAGDIILKNRKIVLELMDFRTQLNRDLDFGKGSIKMQMNQFIKRNYDEMVDFFDLCLGVYGV